MFFVVFALQTALLPLLAADPRPHVLRGAYQRASDIVCLVYVPYAVMCLAVPGPVLNPLFGEPYGHTAASSLRWLAVVPLVFAVAFLSNAGLIAVGEQRAMLLAAVAALVVTVVGDLLLIGPFGPAGAAAMTLVGYLTQAAISAHALRRHSGRPRLLPGLGLALVAGAALAMSLLLVPLPVVLSVPLGLLAYLVVWSVLGVHIVPERFQDLLAVLPQRWAHRLAGVLPAAARGA